MTPPQKVVYFGDNAQPLHSLRFSDGDSLHAEQVSESFSFHPPAQTPETGLSLRFFGAFGITVNGQAVSFTWQARMLFAYLAYHAPRALSRDHLARVFWPVKQESQPESARRSLNVELNHVRKALREQTGLPDDLIVFENNCYRLQWPEPVITDVGEFKSICFKKQRLQRNGQNVPDELLLQAIALCRGVFLEECPQDTLNWVEIERQHLGALFEQVADQYLERCEENGDFAHVTALCHEWLSRDARQETLHRRLMSCYEKMGMCNKAEGQYRLLCQILEREYQSIPSAASTRLYQQIRARCAG